jgi:hypothetical protein
MSESTSYFELDDKKSTSKVSKFTKFRRSVWGDLTRMMISVGVAVLTSYYLNISSVNNANEKITCLDNTIKIITNQVNLFQTQYSGILEFYNVLEETSREFIQTANLTMSELITITSMANETLLTLENKFYSIKYDTLNDLRVISNLINIQNSSLIDLQTATQNFYEKSRDVLISINKINISVTDFIKVSGDDINHIKDDIALSDKTIINNLTNVNSQISSINSNVLLINNKLNTKINSCYITIQTQQLGAACGLGPSNTGWVGVGGTSQSGSIWSGDSGSLIKGGQNLANRQCFTIQLSCN